MGGCSGRYRCCTPDLQLDLVTPPPPCIVVSTYADIGGTLWHWGRGGGNALDCRAAAYRSRTEENSTRQQKKKHLVGSFWLRPSDAMPVAGSSAISMSVTSWAAQRCFTRMPLSPRPPALQAAPGCIVTPKPHRHTQPRLTHAQHRHELACSLHTQSAAARRRR